MFVTNFWENKIVKKNNYTIEIYNRNYRQFQVASVKVLNVSRTIKPVRVLSRNPVQNTVTMRNWSVCRRIEYWGGPLLLNEISQESNKTTRTPKVDLKHPKSMLWFKTIDTDSKKRVVRNLLIRQRREYYWLQSAKPGRVFYILIN